MNALSREEVEAVEIAAAIITAGAVRSASNAIDWAISPVTVRRMQSVVTDATGRGTLRKTATRALTLPRVTIATSLAI